MRCVIQYLGKDVIQKGMLKIYLNVLRNENTVWRLCRAGSYQPFRKILFFWLPLRETKNQNWPNNTDIRIRKKDRTYLTGMEEAELSPGVIKFPQPIF